MSGFDDPRGRRSEELAFEAERAHRSGDDRRARSLFEQAAELEEQAVADTDPAEPRVRGVLAVSSVALWCKARRYDRAETLARGYLDTSAVTDEESVRELRAAGLEARVKLWRGLTPSMRVTLLAEAGLDIPEGMGIEALRTAGLAKAGWDRPAFPTGAARHALARRGLLEVGETLLAVLSGPGWHTPRCVTDLGQAVAEAGFGLIRPS